MVGMGLLLAIFSAALTYSIAVQFPVTSNDAGAALFLQTTATITPQPEDQSEIGSTDGIVIVGGVIVMIVVLPIFLRRREWMRNA